MSATLQLFTFEMRDLLARVFQSMKQRLQNHGIRIEIDMPKQMPVTADIELMRRAIENLIVNAIDAMERGGELLVTGVADESQWEIEIADSGSGVPEQHSIRIFDPFFSTKSDAVGIGLATAKAVALQHGGSIRAWNCPQGGAAFAIAIPRRGSARRAA
ncbi:HAMP domain-containing histidine kinase [Vicingaceae bacterium]|nr:HAMP domain-containing histidine kinase [Vicingaceae bacterium]